MVACAVGPRHLSAIALLLAAAVGACARGVGTAKALEMGRTEGAMSGLAIGICGIITSILALGFELLL